MSITFEDLKEATEYIHKKQDEGKKSYLKKIKGKYVVSITGKLSKLDKKRPSIDMGIETKYENWEDVPTVYNRMLKSNINKKRTAIEIKEIATRELQKRNIKDTVEFYVTPNMSRIHVATIHYPKNEKENLQIGFHPIMEYVNEDFLLYIINHEIDHIEEQND